MGDMRDRSREEDRERHLGALEALGCDARLRKTLVISVVTYRMVMQ
jgi:hypothetical protein